MGKISIGIPTMNRPGELRTLLTSLNQVSDIKIFVHDDGSSKEYLPDYKQLQDEFLNVEFDFREVNRGVSVAKNRLLCKMLDADAEWLFLVEDDMEILHPDAFKNYINACQKSGLQHMNFHITIPGERKVYEDEFVTAWGNMNGVFSIFSRESIIVCGLFDEKFYNAWEHIEHTQRLAQRGYTWAFKNGVADATGAENWIRNNFSESVGPSKWDKNGLLPQYKQILDAQRDNWRKRRPDTYEMIWSNQ